MAAAQAFTHDMQHTHFSVQSHIFADVTEGAYHGQFWTEWFLWNKGVLVADIHHWLRVVCGKAAPFSEGWKPSMLKMSQ
jgi:hypothetical protein